VREIDGSFALLARDGKTVRLARSMDRPMRYFLAKRAAGPALIVADRIDAIYNQLKTEGLVEDARSGKNNIYSCSADPDLMEVARLAAKEIREVEADSAALRHLLGKRKDHARAYFDELAGRFGKDYVPGRSWKALAEALLRTMTYQVVADLGAGEGTLSQLLAQRAEKVIAVDLSPKMVEFGRALAEKHNLPNLEYRIGDIEEPPIEADSVDLAFLSQALHHAEHPQKALDAAYRLLKPGGRLVVLDLLQHSFEEARELYADRWLGFSESDLAAMLESAGFRNIETVVADKESEAPKFQTLLGVACK
jgi:ArsR family transcriptional regulator